MTWERWTKPVIKQASSCVPQSMRNEIDDCQLVRYWEKLLERIMKGKNTPLVHTSLEFQQGYGHRFASGVRKL